MKKVSILQTILIMALVELIILVQPFTNAKALSVPNPTVKASAE